MSNTLLKQRNRLDPFILAQLMSRTSSPQDNALYRSGVFRNLDSIARILALFLPESRFAVNPQNPFDITPQEQLFFLQSRRLRFVESRKSELKRCGFDIAIVENTSPGFSGDFHITFTCKKDDSWARARLHLCEPGEREPILGQAWDAYFILEICQLVSPDDSAQGIICIENLIMPRIVHAAS